MTSSEEEEVVTSLAEEADFVFVFKR